MSNGSIITYNVHVTCISIYYNNIYYIVNFMYESQILLIVTCSNYIMNFICEFFYFAVI